MPREHRPELVVLAEALISARSSTLAETGPGSTSGHPFLIATSRPTTNIASTTWLRCTSTYSTVVAAREPP